MRTTIGLLAGNTLLASAFSPVAHPTHGAVVNQRCVEHSRVVGSLRSGAALTAAMTAEQPITMPGKMSKMERMRSRYGHVYEPEEGWATDKVDVEEFSGFSYADLEAGVGDIATYKRGEEVTGTVIGFEPNGALIDIGVKSSAYVSIAECALEKPLRPEVTTHHIGPSTEGRSTG